METALETTVQCTLNYDQFRSITSNREVNTAHVRKLAGKIGKKNLLSIFPILVTPQLEVIDGQHRLEAARSLGVEIFFQVSDQVTKADIAEVNSSAKNWTAMDYVNYWCVEKADAYIQLSKFLAHFPKVPLSAAQLLLTGSDSRSPEGFRNGEFTTIPYHFGRAMTLGSHLLRMADEFRFASAYHGHFIQALSQCSRVEGFSWERLMRKVEMQPRSLVRCPTQKGYLELLEELYNYKTHTEGRIRVR